MLNRANLEVRKYKTRGQNSGNVITRILELLADVCNSFHIKKKGKENTLEHVLVFTWKHLMSVVTFLLIIYYII